MSACNDQIAEVVDEFWELVSRYATHRPSPSRRTMTGGGPAPTPATG